MATTQLFVELLVIGMGVVAWMGVFAAAVFRCTLYPPAAAGTGELLAAVAMAYVLGIMMDRIARELWGRFLFRPRRLHRTPTHDVERVICNKSERLWNTCVYNRSRLRICRAWTLNFALLAIAYAVWNARVNEHPWELSVGVILAALVLCVLAAWATVRLNRDYYKQLEGVFPLVRDGSVPVATEEDHRQSSSSRDSQVS
jgi:hypothetical protein